MSCPILGCTEDHKSVADHASPLPGPRNAQSRYGVGAHTAEALIHKGEQPTSNTPATMRPRSKRHKTLAVELSGELYDFLVTNSQQNERTLAQEVRFWLKKATGIN